MSIFRQKVSRDLVEHDSASFDRLLCHLCRDIMIEPTQTECGFRFCLKCVVKRNNGRSIECPSCDNQEESFIRDRAIEREIMDLEVRCPNSGCTKAVLFKALDQHLAECDYRQGLCNKCKEYCPLATMKEHVTKHCKKSLVMCHDCGKEMSREDLENIHRNYDNDSELLCDKWNAACPNKCDSGETVTLKTHLRSCVNKIVDCPLREIGCSEKVTRNLLTKHMQNSLSHQLMMQDAVLSIIKERNELRRRYDEGEAVTRKSIDGITQSNEEVSGHVLKMMTTVRELNDRVQKLSTEIEIRKKQSHVKSTLPQSDIVSKNGCATWTISNIREKIEHALAGGQTTVVSETFYLTKPGYNFSLKIYLSGDGRAKKSHLSVFFVLNPGDYDDVITWPFQSKVSISLLSNSCSHSDIKVHMMPDNNRDCYRRPIGNCNTGAGQPEFVRLSDVLQEEFYLYNGALKLTLSTPLSLDDHSLNKMSMRFN